ncbi:MAG TPA: flagellar hook-length control protein FliK [Candidatus Baltobacteraceae bacterium]|jgi:flagellar hook-length control protein FliK
MPAQPPQPASDLLGRMIARAVRADAAVNTSKPPTSVAAAPNAAGTRTASAIPAQSVLFARLIAIIAHANNDGASAQSDGQSHASFDSNAPLAMTTIANPSKQDGTQAFGAQLSTNPTSIQATSATQPNAAAPYRAVDPQAVIEQVVQGIVMRSAGNHSELRMRLSPAHLGDVSLKLTVDGGTINATMIAQNADVRDMLLGNQHQLARSLAEAGLQLGSFSVDVSGNNANGSGGQQQQPTFGNRHGQFGHLGEQDGMDQWIEPRFGPAVLPGIRNPWLLNTLA